MTGQPALYCPRCGTANPPGAQWCVRCGFRPGGAAGGPAAGAPASPAAPSPSAPQGHGRHGQPSSSTQAWSAMTPPVAPPRPAPQHQVPPPQPPQQYVPQPPPMPQHPAYPPASFPPAPAEPIAIPGPVDVLAPTAMPADTPAEESAEAGRRRGRRRPRPPRPTGEAGTVTAAPQLRRIAAGAVDLLLVAVPLIWPFYRSYGRDDSWWPALVLAAGVIMTVGTVAARTMVGRAVGGTVFGVRTIAVGPPPPPRFDAAGMPVPAPELDRWDGEHATAPGRRATLIRLTVATVSLVVLAPVWTPLLDGTGRRRALHDRIAGTRVIDVRDGHDPLSRAARAARRQAEFEAGGDDVSGSPTHRPAAVGSAVLPAAGVDMTPALPDADRSRLPAGVLAAAAGAAPVTDRPVQAETRANPIVVSRAAAAGSEPVVPAPRTAALPVVAAYTAPPETGDEVGADRNVRVLVFDTGDRSTVTGTVLIGRDPAPVSGARTIALADPTMSVSKTHLRVTVDGGMVWVEDLHSTNGSAVEAAGARTGLGPGAPVVVEIGAIVHFGARRFTVEGA